jgi:two-component system chemotaxis response regulator CheY
MNKVILVAEDDNDLLEVYTEILEMNEYKVIKAKDGNEAFIAYKQHMPDLVFMDVDMPKMNGFEASSRILEVDPNAKIIIISGYIDMNDKADTTLQNKIISVISKPMSLDSLLSAVRKFSNHVSMKYN